MVFFFRTGTTTADFKEGGTTPAWIEALHIAVNMGANKVINFLINHVGTGSREQDLLGH